MGWFRKNLEKAIKYLREGKYDIYNRVIEEHLVHVSATTSGILYRLENNIREYREILIYAKRFPKEEKRDAIASLEKARAVLDLIKKDIKKLLDKERIILGD